MLKILVFPLLVFFALNTIFVSFADEPLNNVDGSVAVYAFGQFHDVSGSKSWKIGDLPFGQTYVSDFTAQYTSNDSTYSASLLGGIWRFSVTTTRSSTLYVYTRRTFADDPSFIPDGLLSYRNSAKDISLSQSFTVNRTTYFITDIPGAGSALPNSTITSTSNANSYLETYHNVYICFEGVPAGTYTFTLTGATHSWGGVNWLWSAFGVFVEEDPSISGVVDGYINGSISFPDALSGIHTSLSDALSSAESVDEEIFLTNQAQFELDRLLANSDQKNLQYLESSVNSSYDSILDSYRHSPDIDYSDFLADLDSVYQSALSSAETVEQGTLISANYQIKLKQLELDARQKASEYLSSAVTDQQVADANAFYTSEEEIISSFDLAQFSAILDFTLWLDLLPTDQTLTYRSIFEYLLNDSKIRFFITIPVCFSLVSILFGSVISYASHRSQESRRADFQQRRHSSFF